MSGVLHPVGPEPTQTYWARRGVVLAALVLVLALVVAGVVSVVRAASASAAQPTVPEPAPASPAASATPTDAFSQSPVPEPTLPGPGSTARQADPSGTPAADGSCDPATLRPTLTGAQEVAVGKSTTFELSLINGSEQTCTVTVSGTDFTLSIYRGTDRIWTSADCASAVKKVTKKLESEQDVSWKVTWNGRPSAENCTTAAGLPAAGSYVATAEYEGAEPVRLRLIVKG